MQRKLFTALSLLLVAAACSSGETSSTSSGTSGTSGASGTSGSSGTSGTSGTIVNKVDIDTKGCIGSAASESQVCYDWAFEYTLNKTAAASSACQPQLTCKTAQKGCRLYVDCGAGVPPVCTDLDPKGNTASAQVPYAGETYECNIGYTQESGGRRLFNLTCKSPKFNCVYSVN